MPETINQNFEMPRVIALLGDQLDLAYERADQAERFAAPPSAGSRSPRRRRLVLGIAAMLAVVGALVAFGIGRGDRTIGLNEALGDVAQRIDVVPDPKPSQFEFTRSTSSYSSLEQDGIDYRGNLFKTFIFMRPHEQSSWLSSTRQGRMISNAGKPTFPSAQDERWGKQYFDALDHYEAAEKTREGRIENAKVREKVLAWNHKHVHGLDGFGFPEAEGVMNTNVMPPEGTFVGNELLSEKQLAAYPRDPALIYARIRKGVEKQVARDEKRMTRMPARDREAMSTNDDADEEIWQMLAGTNPWGKYPMPADLRAGFVRALAYLPGVQYAGEAKDGLGRSGDRFTWDYKGKRYDVIYDRDTSVVLSAKETVADPARLAAPIHRHLPVGAVLSEYQMIEQRTLDELPPEVRDLPPYMPQPGV